MVGPRPHQPHHPSRPCMLDIRTLVQCFACYTGVVQSANLNGYQILAYLVQIVKASIDFEGPAWANYNETFWIQEVATEKLDGLGWIDLCFPCVSWGEACISLKYGWYFSASHETRGCPLSQESAGGQQIDGGIQMSSSSFWAICRRFNKACSKDKSCRYSHICMWCQDHHPVIDCRTQKSMASKHSKWEREARLFHPILTDGVQTYPNWASITHNCDWYVID